MSAAATAAVAVPHRRTAQDEGRGDRPRPARDAEREARRSLRAQIARLDAQLAAAVAASIPDGGIDTAVPALDGPRLLALGELEALRDALAGRVAEAHDRLAARARRHTAARAELDRMLADPAANRRRRISLRELGEPGCGVWQVRPHRGLIGMLLGWWRVTLSSGCP